MHHHKVTDSARLLDTVSFKDVLFGPPDPVEEQVGAIQRPGRMRARISHACALMMLVAFSLSALNGIARDSTLAFVQGWTHGPFNLTAGLTALSSVLLVLGMDLATYGALHSLRERSEQGTPQGGQFLLYAWIGLLCLIESGSVAYMGWLNDPPNSPIAAVIVIARALLAPPIFVYLARAQAAPLSMQGVRRATATTSTHGALGDAMRIATDPETPFALRARLFLASADLPAHEDGPVRRFLEELLRTEEELAAEEIGDSRDPDERSNVRTLYVNPPSGDAETPPERARRADSGLSQEERAARKAVLYQHGSAILAQDPGISAREFARRLSIATGLPVSTSTAQALLTRLRDERTRRDRDPYDRAVGDDDAFPPADVDGGTDE